MMADSDDKQQQQQEEATTSNDSDESQQKRPVFQKPSAAKAAPSSLSASTAPSSSASKGGYPPIPYNEPDWAADPQHSFSLQVLKNGTIIDTIPIHNKSRYVVGRLDNCDIAMEHPSISRYHAVIQHKNDGTVYVYDLGSTHGSKLNKTPMSPRKYYQLHIGQMVKFGASTRLFILDGPESLAAEEDARLVEKEEKLRDYQKQKKDQEAQGASWGFSEDAVDEELVEESETDAALLAGIRDDLNAEVADDDDDVFYKKDPKKAIRVFMERFGEDPDYQHSMTGTGRNKQHACTLSLPIETVSGRPLVARAEGPRKKEAEVMCALQACRMLDKRGLLRQAAAAASVRRRKRDDDDDDTFYDRTGDIERKRAARKKGLQQSKVMTYESLSKKASALSLELQDLYQQLADTSAKAKPADEGGAVADNEDAYLAELRRQDYEKQASKLQKEVTQVEMELKDVRRLMEFTKPATLNIDEQIRHRPKAGVPSEANKEQKLQTPQKDSSEKAFASPKPIAAASGSGAKSDDHSNSRTKSVQPENEADMSKSSGPSPERKQALDSALAVAAPDVAASSLFAQQTKQSRGEFKVSRPSEEDRRKVEEIVRKRQAEAHPNVAPEDGDDHPATAAVPEVKRRRREQPVGPALPPLSAQAHLTSSSGHQLAEAGTYEEWTPPEGQTGDGKTSLNEKLGY